jgi:hypothetical protein
MAGTPKAKGRRNILIVVVLIVGLAVAGGVAAVLLSGGSKVAFPDSIAGQDRVTSASLEGLARGMADEATLGSEKPKVAFYGPESTPAFLVMVYEFAGPDLDSEFQGGISGFEGTSGGTVDRSATERAAVGSAEYRCAPFTATGAQGFICMWADDDTTGIVVTLSREQPSIGLTEQVHDAVVA